MSDTMIVNVKQGALRGREVNTVSGGRYFSFQGVPYAQPPVGSLRFKAPQPLEPWSGTRDALKEGNVCPHIDDLRNEYVGEEDCLFLNVYTPQLPASEPVEGTSRAVMVYIHGGGFTAGSGNSVIYGPDYLVDQGVVLVTINYRLGPFGFLSTEDGEIPGNAGMKDQVAALRWVQQNIARFGGDPSNVTIFGESAGGASVHYHLLSPMSKGLFHRAISQSGSALNCWAFSSGGRSRTVRLAKALGCQSEDSRQVLNFLRDIPARKLVDSLSQGLSDQERRRGAWFPFVPISEEHVDSNEEKFLPASPLEIVTTGKFHKVPYITGVNTNEGLLLVKDIMKNPGVLNIIDQDFQGLLPEDMYPELDTDKSREAAQKLKKFYFGEKSLNQDTILQYAELNSVFLFVYKSIQTVKFQVALSQTPLYVYQFAFDGELGMFKRYIGAGHFPGVCHADELGYLFHIALKKLDLDAESPEVKMRNMMVKMWTNFAKTGNPSPEAIQWDPATASKICYLRIDQELKMMENLEKHHIDFWDELYRSSKCD